MPKSLDAILENAHFEGIPAIQACAIRDGKVLYNGESGSASATSMFDVASVTKMAATTLCACILNKRGLLKLNTPVAHFFPDLKNSHTGIQVRHLLAHSSGLPAWKPFFTAALCTSNRPSYEDARVLTIQAVNEALPEHAPGKKRIYSDTGFILLGLILEQVGTIPLNNLARELIFAPAGLENTQFFPLGHPLPERHIVPTGSTRPREPAPGQETLFKVPKQPNFLDPGRVDDDNAYALGGIAGHAGLFSTASDLASLGQTLIEDTQGANHLGAGDRLLHFLRPDHGPEGPLRGLGFDLIAPQGSSTGPRWGKGPKGGFGHLGFTGCALWLDLDRGLAAALLSNRVLPGRANINTVRALRPAFFDGLIAELETD